MITLSLSANQRDGCHINHEPRILAFQRDMVISLSYRTSAKRLHLSQTAVAAQVLLGGLATARQLCITGEDVNVHMPARPSWGHIHLCARGALNLTFDDVDGLAARMPAALFQWWTAHGVGVLNLYKAFQSARADWWYRP